MKRLAGCIVLLLAATLVFPEPSYGGEVKQGKVKIVEKFSKWEAKKLGTKKRKEVWEGEYSYYVPEGLPKAPRIMIALPGMSGQHEHYINVYRNFADQNKYLLVTLHEYDRDVFLQYFKHFRKKFKTQKRFLVTGFSLGGGYAALLGLWFPDYVRAVVSISGNPGIADEIESGNFIPRPTKKKTAYTFIVGELEVDRVYYTKITAHVYQSVHKRPVRVVVMPKGGHSINAGTNKVMQTAFRDAIMGTFFKKTKKLKKPQDGTSKKRRQCLRKCYQKFKSKKQVKKMRAIKKKRNTIKAVNSFEWCLYDCPGKY